MRRPGVPFVVGGVVGVVVVEGGGGKRSEESSGGMRISLGALTTGKRMMGLAGVVDLRRPSSHMLFSGLWNGGGEKLCEAKKLSVQA